MQQRMLLGDEALAQGAVDAGISSAYGYPGTPSTEIMEYLIQHKELEKSPLAEWCSNEKTAYEEALGASLAGRRVLVTMKHVGINVAADAFMNSALLDIRGGLVLAVADDPGMHSSQNEQDSRHYAQMARIPCLEPENQQEAYSMTRRAFDLSEEFHVPVMVRLVTRLSHARAPVSLEGPRSPNPLKKAPDSRGWMLIPALARKRWAGLLERQPGIAAGIEERGWNRIEKPEDGRRGVIAAGIAANYFHENRSDLPDQPAFLHIRAYPASGKVLTKFLEDLEEVLVLEDGQPHIEQMLRGWLDDSPGLNIRGRMDGSLPPDGELNPDNVRAALDLSPRESLRPKGEAGGGGGAEGALSLPGRPPQLCQGCPHGDTYQFIKEAVSEYRQSLVTADIGCYALGALPPYQVPESIVCMGASVGMAKGAAEAGLQPAVAVIGDSTFLHSGMTALVDAVACGTPMTLVILDNSTVAMTGGQPTMVPSARIPKIVEGIGVDPAHLHVVEAHRRKHGENKALLRQELDHPGVSVIITVRECLETLRKRKKAEKEKAEKEGLA